jgi:hypothetical protein
MTTRTFIKLDMSENGRGMWWGYFCEYGTNIRSGGLAVTVRPPIRGLGVQCDRRQRERLIMRDGGFAVATRLVVCIGG